MSKKLTAEESWALICLINSFHADRADAGSGFCPPQFSDALLSAYDKLAAASAEVGDVEEYEYFLKAECSSDPLSQWYYGEEARS